MKNPPANVGDLGSVPGLGRSPGEGKGYPLQYSCLKNSMDCIVPGVAKSWTRLSDSLTTHEGNVEVLTPSACEHDLFRKRVLAGIVRVG